jgi:AcrR family transcriptional regulator
MAQGEDPATAATRKSDRAREALVDAGTRLLSERAPSTISGRELADAAGVNYGLVHHYFGSKDAVLRAAIFRMRDEFLDRHPHPERIGLLVGERDPFLAALVRSQIDYPNDIGGPVDGDVIGAALVGAIRERLGGRADGPGEAEAKARAIAQVALQLGYGVFRAMLLDIASVTSGERAAVERALGDLYDELGLVDHDDETT